MTTIQLKNYQVIAIMVAAIVLLFIIFRGCNTTDPVIAESKRQVDSVIAVNKELQKTVSATHYNDSVNAAYNKRVNDSISKIADKREEQLTIKSLSTSALAKEVQLYAKYKDTVEQLRAAPLLADQVIGLVDQVDSFKATTRTLRNSLDSTVGSNSLVKAKLEYNLSETQGQFDFLVGKYSKRDYEAKKAEKQANKRFILGPQITVSYFDGKPQVVGGIGATYRIARF